ncbi:MAG: glycosyltransferase [Planctomycetales bacterium]|nr:glycosyltransferase [Planctomycetales bacterium]
MGTAAAIKAVFAIGGMYGGGSERQMVSLLRHLDTRRFRPALYLASRAGPLLEELPEELSVTSFDERYRGSHWPQRLMYRRRVLDMAKYLREVQADVCYDRTFLMTLISAAAAQRAGVPNISTVVTDPTRGFAPIAGRFQFLKRRILRRLYRRSRFVLANSTASARNAERFYGLPAGLITTHYNGIDLERVERLAAQPVNDPWWHTRGDGRAIRIVAAGRLNREKGFHHLIDAVAQISREPAAPSFRVAILGEGDARATLAAQIDQHQLSESVHLVGFQNNPIAWFQSADLFVLSSLLEGMPNVLLEAMACGTPVLSTDCPSGPAEITREGEFGALCQVDSSEALAAGIRQYLRDPAAARTRAAAAQRHVGSTFSIQTAVARLEELLELAAAR